MNEVYRSNKDPRRNYRPKHKPVPDPTKSSRQRKPSNYDPTIVCHACGQRGHKAARCFALAASLYLEKYKKNILNEEEMQQALTFWQERNAPILKDAITNEPLNKSPKQILRTYLEKSWNDMDTVTDQMDWVYFDEGGTEEEVFGIMGGYDGSHTNSE